MHQSVQHTIVLLLVLISALRQTKIKQAKVLFEQRKYDQLKKVITIITDKYGDFNAAQYYLVLVAFEEKNIMILSISLMKLL